MKKIETREHVQAFLNSFLPKFDIWGIFFIDRKKNDEAIAALGITPAQREDIIRNIETDDYIETIVDEMSFGDMWVFGKDWVALTAEQFASRSINPNFLTNTHSKRKANDEKIRKY